MKRINVLILGVGGNVSQGILTAIKSSNLNCHIVGACISEESLGLFYCDTAYISPYANDSQFVDWVINICNIEKIDIVFSGVEDIIMALEAKRQLFELKTKAIFIASSKEQLAIGMNKYKTSKWLQENDCNFPKYADISNNKELEMLVTEVGYPLIAKPTFGKGSQGIIVINSHNELKQLKLLKQSGYCIQEYLGDEKSEYTVACYVDKKGKTHQMLIMHRYLKYGTTFMAEIVHEETIQKECERICELFKPVGPLNIQLRMHKGKPVCFEINVRFSGTTPIRAKWGYNDVEAMIREYVLDEPVSFNPQKEGKVYRYYNEAFIDVKMQNELKSSGIIKNCRVYNNYFNLK